MTELKTVVNHSFKVKEVSIIPLPSSLAVRDGVFLLDSTVRMVVSPDAQPATYAVAFLQKTIQASTGFNCTIAPNAAAGSVEKTIRFITPTRDAAIGDEAYLLDVTPDAVTIQARSAAGFFYGVQTFLQLLPPEIYGRQSGPADREWSVPCVQIEDRPRFPWRGVMLDVSRHVMNKDAILRYIDCLAMHKFNIFHWHLVDDQGWRIEILKYPKLTEIGAWRVGNAVGELGHDHFVTARADGRYGGFYTQADVREVVAYAAERHIAVVPELELPGHSLAALSAYPDLSCNGGPFEVFTRTGISADVYCAGSEQTFRFLEDVIDELIPLFPSAYFHIGGDECPKDRWKQCPKCQARLQQEGLKDENELQSYFVRRIERYLATKGKRLIGWDEILEGGLAPNATVMSWRGTVGGIEAATAGHDVIMTPGSHCYLNFPVNADEDTFLFNEYLPLEKVYSFEPIPAELTADAARHVLGLQANLWTEFMYDMDRVEYMTWPRGAALAEVGWTAKDQKHFPGFLDRMKIHEQRLAARGVSFWPIQSHVTRAASCR